MIARRASARRRAPAFDFPGEREHLSPTWLAGFFEASTRIRTVVSNWRVEHGVFVSGRFADVTVAVPR
jgi:hypothetical protein